MKEEEVADYFRGKRVVIMGSAPNVLNNKGANIENYDIIVRVNNYKIHGFEGQVGKRCDVHYSFYGRSVRKTPEQLKTDGVKLHMCKCPNSLVFGWEHKIGHNNFGGDYRYIYSERTWYWFTCLYIPTKERFLEKYHELGDHIPTTGFAAIQDIVTYKPLELYITGFDFMTSGIHNVNERWRPPKDRPKEDWGGHDFEKEKELLQKYLKKYNFILTGEGVL